MSRKGGLGPLLLAGLAAFGYYKYSKMSTEEKDRLKEKGRKLYEENVPEHLRSMISGKGKTQPAGHQNGSGDSFTQS